MLAALVAAPVALYAAARIVNWHDQPPSPEALLLSAAYDARPVVADGDNAFVYFLGFSAALTEDPRANGQRMLRQLESADPHADAVADRLPAALDFLGADPEVAHFRTLCDNVGRECVLAAAEARGAFEKWSATHAWLLDRYRELIDHPEWRELVPRDVATPLPLYTGVLHGQRLLLLQANVLADTGDAAGVSALLGDDLRFWRTVLASCDLLITKMIAVAAVQRHFQWGNLALRRLSPERASAALPAEWLAPLTATELSLKRTVVGEWRFSSRSLLGIREQSNGSLGDKLAAPLYQPQDTLNLYAAYFTELAATLEAPLAGYADVADRASQLAARTADEGLPPHSLYNLFGVLLFHSAGPPDYSDYARRVADTEGVRRAALATVTLRAAQTPPSDMAAALAASPLRSPYDDRPLVWDASEQAVVFVGLSPGERREQRFYY